MAMVGMLRRVGIEQVANSRVPMNIDNVRAIIIAAISAVVVMSRCHDCLARMSWFGTFQVQQGAFDM